MNFTEETDLGSEEGEVGQAGGVAQISGRIGGSGGVLQEVGEDSMLSQWENLHRPPEQGKNAVLYYDINTKYPGGI